MSSPLDWSLTMQQLFDSEVLEPVRDDPRTDWSDDLTLGYPFAVIREEVVSKGLADFRKGHEHPQYGTLTATDKVKLYCFLNLRRHFFACMATFEAHRAAFDALLVDELGVYLIDIGCGPGTVGLAFADSFPGLCLHYLGVDLAATMQEQAKAFWNGAMAKGLLGAESTSGYFKNWSEIDLAGIPSKANVMLTLSYCCASEYLPVDEVESLAEFIGALRDSRDHKPVTLVYTNSVYDRANHKYWHLKRLLGLDPDMYPLTQLCVDFRRRRGSETVNTEEFVHEVLRLKKG